MSFYFECLLLTFIQIALQNQLSFHRKDVLSPSAKKASFSRFHLLNVSPFSVLLSLYIAAFLPQFCSPSTTFSRRFRLQHLYIFFIISPDHLSDVIRFTSVISSFYCNSALLISSVIHQSYISQNHHIYVIYTKSPQQQSPYP